MKKNLLTAVIVFLSISSISVSAAPMWFSFEGGTELYDPTGVYVGGDPENITGLIEFDFETGLGSAEFSQLTTPFFGNYFFFHDTVLSGNSDGTINVNGLMDWGATTDIHFDFTWKIVELVELSDPVGGTSDLGLRVVTLDGDGDGIAGTAMTDGPFTGFSMTMDGMWIGMDLYGIWEPPPPYNPVPVPAAIWLFMTGIMGLACVAKKHKSA